MGNKARRIRSSKFSKKFATLRAKAAERLGLGSLKEEVKESYYTEVLAPEPEPEPEKAEAAPAKAEAAPAPAAAPKKKVTPKRKKKTDDA